MKVTISIMNDKSNANIREVHELISQMRTEVLGEIKALREDFLTMEKGRLTILEGKFERVDANLALMQKIVYGAVGVILTAVLGAILALVIL